MIYLNLANKQKIHKCPGLEPIGRWSYCLLKIHTEIVLITYLKTHLSIGRFFFEMGYIAPLGIEVQCCFRFVLLSFLAEITEPYKTKKSSVFLHNYLYSISCSRKNEFSYYYEFLDSHDWTPAPVKICWTAPLQDNLKLIFDAFFIQDACQATMGGVIRYRSGVVICSMSD